MIAAVCVGGGGGGVRDQDEGLYTTGIQGGSVWTKKETNMLKNKSVLALANNRYMIA